MYGRMKQRTQANQKQQAKAKTKAKNIKALICKLKRRHIQKNIKRKGFNMLTQMTSSQLISKEVMNYVFQLYKFIEIIAIEKIMLFKKKVNFKL